MHHYEVIFSKSLRSKGVLVLTTITEVVQSSKYIESEAEIDANNKVERHPLAKAGWLWSLQKMTRSEVRDFRNELKESVLADSFVKQNN